MNRLSFLSFFFIILFQGRSAAQGTLPNITVRNENDVIIVSWKNDYIQPVKNINIQRSYDSLKNYSTIGSVLNPQNRENGFADSKPPYNKMYYRVFISFDGGTYSFSEPARPIKDLPADIAAGTPGSRYRDTLAVTIGSDPANSSTKPVLVPKPTLPSVVTAPIIAYPSKRVYTGKDNNIVLNLPDASTKKYLVKFFNEEDVPVFELNRLPDNYLIIEKVNFIHSGWYNFELYENGRIIEKNKFYIPKDGKQAASKNERGKR